MKLFKKCMVLVLALMMLLCICACSQTSDDVKDTTPSSVPTSSTPATQPSSSGTVIPDDQQQSKVAVVDEEGNPIVGVFVQLCTEETCLMPVKTDDAGVAMFTPANEAEYHAKLTKVPEGYEAEAEDFYFADGETELTIVLKVIAG